jgi:predicted DNA-binding transcriptional regulator YafY
MNRTDRLLAIVLELQARRYTRASELADRFEIAVRTVYRDILALCEAGVPVVSTPGYGYTLPPGYFLPPLMLTADEACGLLLGTAFVADQVDAPYRQAMETAGKKIEKLLPDSTRREVESLLETLRFMARPRPANPDLERRLTMIRKAVAQRQVLRLTYHARRGELAARDVEPHGLMCMDGIWMLQAYCRTRQGARHFRLDRMDAVTPLGERFTRREGLTVRRHRPIEPGPVEIRALFGPDALRWARESRPMGFVREEEHPDGVVMVFRPRDWHDLVPWFLSWGPSAQVLSPSRLRAEISAAARATADLYGALADASPAKEGDAR